jgi:hypothetical protein
MSKRGHSNVYADKTKPWDSIDPGVESGIARIPLTGGSTASSARELPPLALRRSEWREIGVRMGWLVVRDSGDDDD